MRLLFSLRLSAPLGRCWVPFWRPLDFEGVPKSTLFVLNEHKITKKDVHAGVLKQTNVCMKLYAKMEGLKMPKRAFFIIRVAKYEVSVFREKASKMRSNRDPKMIKNHALDAQGVRFASFGEVV